MPFNVMYVVDIDSQATRIHNSTIHTLGILIWVIPYMDRAHGLNNDTVSNANNLNRTRSM